MGITLERFHRVSSRGTVACLTLVAILGAAAPARSISRSSRFEVTPIMEAWLGGTFEIQPDGPAPS
jgi:hypothetical protein